MPYLSCTLLYSILAVSNSFMVKVIVLPVRVFTKNVIEGLTYIRNFLMNC
jgi:hypothetical protein